ncbi:SDR family NAD(P)-dependent oxidoreductase [uncultured Maricaulis sp.]|uniref:SDR family NAD(P)-dependent oxidoreductase n=1 Tax=uncultured Maricaulis sp. TaxID=174710 RepID=UPI00261C1935|nr:SDR family NAD(P)-dependent oxidoreductase [uncultured Maricaulis sp.]
MANGFYGAKTFWVTGASSGLGRAMAIGLSQRGARVILSGRNEDALAETRSQLAGDSHVLAFETTDYEALPGIVDAALTWSGRIDGLINNAGISQRSLIVDTEMAVYRRLMEVDFFAPVALTKLVLPHMIAAGSGHVSIVSSLAGKIGTPVRSGYCAAKHACVGFYESMRAEVEKAYGISVSVILPGSVQTGISRNALSASGAPRGVSDANIDGGMKPEAAAALILDGIAAGQNDIVIAEGMEAAALGLRTRDPEQLFAILAEQGRELAASAGSDEAIELRRVNDHEPV